MRNALDIVRRVSTFAMLAAAVAHCGGGSDVRVNDTGVRPSSGVFVGTTSEGTTITIEVGSIEAVTFQCHGVGIQNIFGPPGDVDIDGTFDLHFDAEGRRFDFSGQFTTQNLVQGAIDDADDACDVTFQACRNGCGTPTPVPTRTATPVPTLTPTRTVTPLVTMTGPTITPVGVTATPTVAPTPVATDTVTPTPTATSTPFCGNSIKDPGEDCDTGGAFGASNGDCATQCACCYCRPLNNAHGLVTPNTTKCSTCHGMGDPAPGTGPKPPKPGAVETFGNDVCN